MKKSGFDQYYDEAVEPGKRERAYAWATAIGLQDVDGLKPSKHLLATAKRHIEGEITQEEARRIVDEYYETKDGHNFFASVLNTDQRMRRKSQICIGEKMTMAWGVMRGVIDCHHSLRSNRRFAVGCSRIRLLRRRKLLNCKRFASIRLKSGLRSCVKKALLCEKVGLAVSGRCFGRCRGAGFSLRRFSMDEDKP